MIITRLALLACLLPTGAFAALSGEYQRAAELTAIINNNAVTQALQNQPINSVVMTGTDAFEVASDHCTVVVTLFDLPAPEGGWTGPRQFDLTVGVAVCR